MNQLKSALRRRGNHWFLPVITLAFFVSLGMTAAADRANAPVLKRLSVPPQVVGDVATRLDLRYHDHAGVTITVDDQISGGLLILAPPDQQAQIASDVMAIAGAMMKEVASAGTTTASRHLVHVTWREFEDTLREIGGDVSVTTSRNGERASFQIPLGQTAINTTGRSASLVEVDRRENTITFTAAPAQVQAWKTIVDTIDQPSRSADQQIVLHRIRYADAAPIQRAVRLLRELGAKTSPAPRPPVRRDRPASTRGQAQFRTAAFQNTDTAKDQAADDGPTPAADVQPLDGVDDNAAMEGGVIGDTQIQFIPESGLIVIKGNKRDVQRVMDVIKEIEKQSEVTRPEVEVRQLLHADANAVAALLTQLYTDVLSARQGDVSITPLDAPNALLLIGRNEAIAAVMELIQKIDQPIPETDRLRVYRLQHASAIEAETTIREFFTNLPGEDEDPRPGLGVRVRITADYRTNSLIVGAAPRDLEEVTRLIEELDIRDIPATSEIRVFPLFNARAEDLVDVLRDALTGEPEDVPADTTPKSSVLSIVALGAPGNPVLDSGVLTGTVVTADNNANALVVRAPGAAMPLIAELIRQLDKAPGIDSIVKVFTIQNGDATQLTTALQTLFGDDASTSGTSVGAGNQAGLPALSAAPSALVPLRFSTDVRTNSIITSGSAEDLEVVESILLRLDSTGFAERITEVIWLKHQIADNIATAIQTYVQQRQQFQNIVPQFQQGLGPFDLPDRDVIVVAEAQTNSLLISVSPRLYEEVRRLIDRLDRRPPMVLIKTLIAEVRLDDGFEIGGEFGLQDSILFDRGKASGNIATNNPPSTTVPLPSNTTISATGTQISNNVTVEQLTPLQSFLNGVGFNFNNAGTPNINSYSQEKTAARGVTAFGVGAGSLRPGTGGANGFVFSAASESVNLLLRTLRTANRLQILSRPEVMTADNTEGYVNVGQLFPRPTNITQTNLGQTLIGIEDIPVGIILRVRPRVGADGLILMDIDATRSAVNQSLNQSIGTDSEGNAINVPAIDQTTAQSTITAFDGQTVVFGGLITKNRQNISRRVPYLADIPLLGVFFKYEAEIENRSELLIVMTPTLVTGDEDIEYVKQVESGRMSWCLSDVVEMHGDEGLSGGYGLWGPAIGPTIYPDLHPTADVFPAHDLPGGPRAIHPTSPGAYGQVLDGSGYSEFGPPAIPTGAGVPHGIQLNPGESLLSDPQMLSPTVESLPVPVQIAPPMTSGASSSSSTSVVKPVSHQSGTNQTPVSAEQPRRWFQFRK